MASKTASSPSIDATKLTSSELQALSSLLFGRTELYESFISRTDAEIASGLTSLLHQLDEPKQKLLMQKLTAVSPKADLIKVPMVVTWFTQAIKTPSLTALLQTPDAHHALIDATSSDPKLSLARDILLGHILPSPSPSSPLTAIQSSLREARSKFSSAKDATSVAGLSLIHYVSCRLGLELPPHIQLVNLLLGTSVLHLHLDSNDSSLSTFDPALLLQVAHDMVSSHPSASFDPPNMHQGQFDPSLHALLIKMAAADKNGSASKLLTVISDLRRCISSSSSATLSSKAPLLPSSASSSNNNCSIIPAIAISTTDDDLKSLSPAQRTTLSTQVHKIEAMAKALDGLLPKEPSTSSNSTFCLNQILNLPLETRLALAWHLRTEEAAALATPTLISLLHKSSLDRRSKHQEEAESFTGLLSAFSLEKTVSELDLASPPGPEVPQGKGADGVLSAHYERYGPTAPPLPPSDAELYRLLSKSDPASLDTSPLEVLINGQQSRPASLDAFKVLVQEGLEGKEEAAMNTTIPSTLKEFFSQAKLNMNRLSPTMLALLACFSSFQIRVGKEEAMEAQGTARALVSEVLNEIRRSDQIAAARQEASSRAQGSGSSVPMETPPSLMNPLTGSIVPIDPNIVSAILKSEDPSSPTDQAYRSWLQFNLSPSPAATSFESTGEGGLQPYDILAEQHLAMDMDRYLTLRRAPELSLSFDILPTLHQDGASTGPSAAAHAGDAASFLESSRRALDGYLEARGMKRMTEVEWEAYSSQALAEHELMREEHEVAMKEVMGTSSFHSPRAEEEHLRAQLAAGVKKESPIYDQAKSYLEVLLANPSWSFAQREAIVGRLCELSEHYSGKKSRATLRGSPLAPLFASKESEAPPLIPKLKRK